MLVTNVSQRLITFHKDILPGQTIDLPKELETKDGRKLDLHAAIKRTPAWGVELVEGKVAMPVSRQPVKGLRDMTPSQAIGTVSKEKDADLLDSWELVEERDSVRAAIAARLQTLRGK